MKQNQENQNLLRQELRELISDMVGELAAYTFLSVGLVIVFTCLFAFSYFMVQLFLPLEQAVIAALGIMSVVGLSVLFYKNKPAITSNHYFLFFSLSLGIQTLYYFYNILVVPETIIWLEVSKNAAYGTVSLFLILAAFIFIGYHKLSKLEK